MSTRLLNHVSGRKGRWIMPMVGRDRPVQIQLKNILFLTDFSGSSEEALPFAIGLARGAGAKIQALHIFTPALYVYTAPELTAAAIEAEEDDTNAALARLESQLAGVSHEAVIERSAGVWPAVQQAIREQDIDLIVLGTHGRTGAKKLLLGSVAEEIFRRSPVPVLTIGPEISSSAHRGGQFHRVLFATDFTVASAAATQYAVTLARQNHARLILLHVIPRPRKRLESNTAQMSAAEAMHELFELIPKESELRSLPETVVEFGEPADGIVRAAKERGADVIVIGIREGLAGVEAATHVGRATAHEVVAHAKCPVLTVRY